MPSVLLTESVAVELGASEPWPQDVKLFQPNEYEQILLPCSANSLAVRAFLRMCGLNFSIEIRPNAEHMSPSGAIPFIKCGAFVVSEFDPIVSLVNSKGLQLSNHLDVHQQGDVRAYMSLVQSVLANAELYISWCDDATFSQVTRPRYGSVYPWPLNHIMVWKKQNQVLKKLEAAGWKNKSLESVYREVEDCCEALSERLGNNEYFFNNRPTELDALVFGHLFTILTTPLPANRLASIVRSQKNLTELCQRIERKFFEQNRE